MANITNNNCESTWLIFEKNKVASTWLVKKTHNHMALIRPHANVLTQNIGRHIL